MKNLIVILIFTLFSTAIFAQKQENDTPRLLKSNSVQLNLGGHGGFYSVSYERFIFNHNRFKTSIEGGLAYYPPKTGVITWWLPITINQLYSIKKNHHIELGAGHIFNADGWGQGFWATKIGYRYQKPDGKFLFKAAFTPVFEVERLSFIPTGGISFGYAF